MKWLRTDDLQFVKKENEDEFVVLETTYFPDSKQYVLQERDIDLTAYSEERLNELVDGYHDSLDEIKKEYGDEWKQVVAEIIAEIGQIYEWDTAFDSRKDLFTHLKSNYGIEGSPEDYLEKNE